VLVDVDSVNATSIVIPVRTIALTRGFFVRLELRSKRTVMLVNTYALSIDVR
jgi:hypothetical protein